MSTGRFCVIGNRVLITALVALGWLIAVFCWLALSWSQYSLFQNLVSMSISTLIFSAVIGVMWTVELGFSTAATILVKTSI